MSLPTVPGYPNLCFALCRTPIGDTVAVVQADFTVREPVFYDTRHEQQLAQIRRARAELAAFWADPNRPQIPQEVLELEER